MSTELASLLIDIIFRTVAIYDDLRSRKAVDDVIVRALGGTVFMKTFAGALVQNMEKQSKFQSHVGGYRLLSWSCLLLSKSQFAAVSKNALCRVAAAQASLLSLVLRRSFRERKACRKKFLHLFSQVQLNRHSFYFIDANTNTCVASSIFCFWVLISSFSII